ncbi:MAG: hypothetical protein Q8P68_01435 [Candidatus Peregrinibacteria bacterium]|nr:hypothetical protein [Candidatus Peregrinibacteria bacterium]MDZ4244301.1 hypothetical protein [Candidatus Gracilibacteria bacterium]
MTTCTNCSREFQITDKDLELYKKIGVPSPTHCHDCRQQRRLAWRNERFMYKRKCDFSGKDIVSMYPPDSPFKVYESDIWWSDKWDGLEYGRDFDFSRPFFEQFRELQLEVPRAALVNKQSENSQYTNHAGKNKNCYLSGCIFNSEDCYYSDWIMSSRDSIDCSYFVENNEIAYETYYAWNSYKVFFCDFIRQCSDLWFCYDCIGVKDSFMCWNLRNAKYCIRNVQYTREEYEAEIAKLFPLSIEKLQELRKEYINIKNGIAIRPVTYIINSENSIGDLLFESKNVYYSFDSIHSEDSSYLYDSIDMKDSMDAYHVGWSELTYECHAITNSTQARFSHFSYDNNYIDYCDCVHNSKNLFGCAGLVSKEYCILNKQYSRAEYEALVPKIIEHMTDSRSESFPNGEFGEFFPINFSPFAYNQGRAIEYYPITKEQAEAKGYRWSNYIPTPPALNKSIQAEDLPQTINEVDNSILTKAIICKRSGRAFRIAKGELEFYRNNNLPLPQLHPDERYSDRMAQRTPRSLWERPCTKCNSQTWTSHAPNTTAKMYCQACYKQTIYG